MSPPPTPVPPDLPPLPPAVQAALPPRTPPPPWHCRVDAVLWWHRADPTARGALPRRARAGLPVAVGALVRYRESPVGPYREVLLCPRLLRGRGLVRTTVPFIAVDAVASLAGGRTHWALPKVPADFCGEPPGPTRAAGDGWELSAAPAPVGPWLPVAGRVVTTQDGVRAARSSVRGRARLARVRVEGSGLPPWCRPGRHPGLVLADARLVVGPPR